MAKYKIRNKELTNQAAAMQNIGKTFTSFENRLASISSSMDTRDSSMASLRNQLVSIKNNLPSITKKIVSAGIAAENIANTYETAEKSNYYNLNKMNVWNSDNPFLLPFTGLASYLFDNGLVDTATAGMHTAGSVSLLQLTRGSSVLDILKGSKTGSVENKYGTYKDSKAFKEVKPEKRSYKNYAYEKGEDANQMVIPETVPYAEKKGTIISGELEGILEGSLLHFAASGKSDWGEGSIDAKVGTAELHGKLSGGLYVFDKDGNKVLAPSIDAEVGASVSLLAITAAGKVGNDMLGGYADAEIAAGKYEAKGTASVSIFNEKGQLDLQAKAKASAEAVAFEAKGSAGVTVLGTDIGVSGSVKVGVGVHAEVGIVDGVVKVDVGASLGIGFSVGFEVDIGGAVDAVCGAAKGAWNAVKGWFGW